MELSIETARTRRCRSPVKKTGRRGEWFLFRRTLPRFRACEAEIKIAKFPEKFRVRLNVVEGEFASSVRLGRTTAAL
jgi:hypothetical protein